MARGRHAHHGAPVRFIFFQDVMMLIIGILLMIMLLLVISGIEGAAAAVSSPPQDGTNLSEREAAVRARLDALTSTDRSSGSNRPLEVLVQKRAELSALYEQIKVVEASIRKEFADASSRTAAHGDAAKTLDGMRATEQAVELLKMKLGEARRNHTLTYIARQEFHKQPVVVELAASQWRLAGSASSNMSISLSQTSREERLNALMAFLDGFPSDGNYVLLIIKPSAVNEVAGVGGALRKAGYDLGLDLLPEGWTATVRAGAEP